MPTVASSPLFFSIKMSRNINLGGPHLLPPGRCERPYSTREPCTSQKWRELKNPRTRVSSQISFKPLKPLVQKDCIETRGTEGRIPDFRRIFVHSCSHPDDLRASTIAAHQHIQTSACCQNLSHAPILRLIWSILNFIRRAAGISESWCRENRQMRFLFP